MKTNLTTFSALLSLLLISIPELQAQQKEKTTDISSETAIENLKAKITRSYGIPSSEFLDLLGIIGEETIAKISGSFREAWAACRAKQMAKLLGRPSKGRERIPLRIGEVVKVPALSELEINEVARDLRKELLQTLTTEQVDALLRAEKDHLKEIYGTAYTISAIPNAERKKSETDGKPVEGITGLNRQLKGIRNKSYSVWITKVPSEKPEQIGDFLNGYRYDLFEIKEK